MITKDALCNRIRTIYPDIGECGIDLDTAYDESQQRWTVTLKKDRKEIKTFLEPGDAEFCLLGKNCIGLAVEISQLKDSMARKPESIHCQ